MVVIAAWCTLQRSECHPCVPSRCQVAFPTSFSTLKSTRFFPYSPRWNVSIHMQDTQRLFAVPFCVSTSQSVSPLSDKCVALCLVSSVVTSFSVFHWAFQWDLREEVDVSDQIPLHSLIIWLSLSLCGFLFSPFRVTVDLFSCLLQTSYWTLFKLFKRIILVISFLTF